MRLIVLLFLLTLCNGSLLAQQVLSGKIVDAHTGLPIDYVNIGVIDKAQGTVSDKDGTFNLSIYEASPIDIVQISRIGYTALKFSFQEFEKRLAKQPVLTMQEEFTELEEVVLDLKEAKKHRIGYNQITKDLVAYWNNRQALGGEHASKIMVRKGPVKLEDLSFQVVRNITDSLLVRVNVYEIDKGLPGRNISKANILYTITKKSGRVIIDLSPYNIVVDDHFIVGLEMLKVYGAKTGMTIAAYNDGYRSYSRSISQDRWRRMRSGITIAFNLNTSPVEKSMYVDSSPKKKKAKPSEVKILWDRSLSMQNRDLKKELGYLDVFFKNLKNVKVNLQLFGYELGNEQLSEIKNGKWDALKYQLRRIVYDGSTRPSILQNLQTESFTLIFTDGLDFFEDINRTWKGEIYTISSCNVADNDLLATIAEESGGAHIDLTSKHDLKMAADYKRMYGNYRRQITSLPNSELEYFTIQGNVSDYEDPLENVMVEVKNSDIKTKTNAKGYFNIRAQAGETLVFSYPGRNKIEAIVNAGTKNLTIAMPMGVRVLDEVVLNKRIQATVVDGIARNKEKVTTKYGILDPEKTGFDVKQIKGDKLFQGANNIVEAIEGKFPGVRVVRDNSMQFYVPGTKSRDDPQGLSRSRNMFQSDIPLIALRGNELRGPFAAWDVDGLFYLPNEVPYHIFISNIESITIMPGSWAAARYGRDAAGGIIIVRTITNSFDDAERYQNPLYDQAKLRNNFYKGKAVFPDDKIWQKPQYLREIDQSESLADAYSNYIQQRPTWGNSTEFYADVHNHIIANFASSDKAGQIISNIREISASDVNALRLLAYKYDEQGLPDYALEVYQTIAELSPEELQSQRDLANAHVQTRSYQKAWDEYNNFLILAKDSLSDDGLDQVVRQEMLDLVEKHYDKIELNKSDFQFAEEKEDISIIVQWNNPNAEFELQFVGPSMHYYTWKHTEEENNQLLARERLYGAYSQSFSIQDIGEGPWMINSRYLGNKEGSATYLKFTIRNNQQKKETVKVLKLKKSDVNYRSLNISEKEVISLFK